MLSLRDVDLDNKRVLIRADFNVPIENGKILDATRIDAAIPTIEYALRANARVRVTSHLGSPEPLTVDQDYLLRPVAEYLLEALSFPVHYCAEINWLESADPEPGQLLVCENTRFFPGELSNSEELSRKFANLCDVFIMDAFATSHRQHASTCGVAQYAPIACAGLLLEKELSSLEKIFTNPKHPVLAIVGGAKVSSKLGVLRNLLDKIDYLIVGGGIANTFLAAAGNAIGKSLYEAELVSEAKSLLAAAKQKKTEIILPEDAIDASECSATASPSIKTLPDITATDCILDIGPATALKYSNIIKKAKTILWGGPVGVFEIEQFAEGTKIIASAIATSSAFSVAGGGDTVAAINKFQDANNFSYISTGGSAFLSYLEGKTLPAIAALKSRSPQGTS